MRITHDYHEFFRVTGLIRDLVRVKALGLETNDIFATFWAHEMEDVLEFCSTRSEFHIVSLMGEGVFINRYDAKGIRFQLAEGDDDSTYMLQAKHICQWLFGR